MATEKRGLGRGLSALLGEAGAAQAGGGRELAVDLMEPNPDQPRRSFNDLEIKELADSIKEKGLLQPILVRPSPFRPGRFQVVAGERRWRAARVAGLKTVPVVERDLDDAETLEIAVIENVQRADLTPLEEAYAFRTLMDNFGRTQEGVAETVGKSRSHVANTLRLLTLPRGAKMLLEAGKLTAGHARALLSAAEPDALARRIVDEELSVREAEALARAHHKPVEGKAKGGRPSTKSADTAALERDLTEWLGLKVDIVEKGQAGEVRISYRTLDQLDEVCRRLSRPSGQSGAH